VQVGSGGREGTPEQSIDPVPYTQNLGSSKNLSLEEVTKLFVTLFTEQPELRELPITFAYHTGQEYETPHLEAEKITSLRVNIMRPMAPSFVSKPSGTPERNDRGFHKRGHR